MTVRVCQLAPGDLERIDALRRALWPGSPIDDLKAIVTATADYRVLVALEGENPVGFAEVAVRQDYVNGCDTSPVAFLEGIYVDPAHRRTGVARALINEALHELAAQGIREFASDALLEDEASHAFHQAIGFAETERVVYFRRLVAQAA